MSRLDSALELAARAAEVGDRLIELVSPRAALRRQQFRKALAAYEAATPSRLRKWNADNRSGDSVVSLAGTSLRGYARQLEQNYDVAKGALDVLVNNIVGPSGVNIEPMPRTLDGKIHTGFARQLRDLHRNWKRRPEVTWELSYAAMERLACRTWIRDGELLAQFLEGRVPALDHGTRVPFSLELIESDLLPMDLDDAEKGITSGVERNAWGRPIAYHVYKQHPGDSTWRIDLNTKRVSADRIIHPKVAARIRQARGVSVFASVIRRLEDLKDYEESERIAARVAAAMTGYIKKGTTDDYVAPDSGKSDRTFTMKPGMVFDKLLPGEEVGTIDSNRPSGLLAPFHDAMMRFFATGVGANYSSISRNYRGSYSSQRQELVEGFVHYQVLTNLFVSQFSQPVWERFVRMAVASGQIQVPPDLDVHSMDDADFRGPAMPWIDPVKEVQSNKQAEMAGYKSAQQIIRERNGNPDETLDQVAEWRARARELGVSLDTDPSTVPAAAASAGGDKEEEEEDAADKVQRVDE